MGKIAKVSWPKGRDMKPAQKSRAAQPIPSSRAAMLPGLPFPRPATELLTALPGEPPELLAFNRTWLQTEQAERVRRLTAGMLLTPAKSRAQRAEKAFPASRHLQDRTESRLMTASTATEQPAATEPTPLQILRQMNGALQDLAAMELESAWPMTPAAYQMLTEGLSPAKRMAAGLLPGKSRPMEVTEAQFEALMKLPKTDRMPGLSAVTVVVKRPPKE